MKHLPCVMKENNCVVRKLAKVAVIYLCCQGSVMMFNEAWRHKMIEESKNHPFKLI